MGLLSTGHPMTWDETKKYAEHVRKHGIIQFIKTYHKLKERQDQFLRWGDEIEYMLISFDHQNKKARVCLKAESILEEMKKKEVEKEQRVSLWKPEFGAFMIEGTPGSPYGAINHNLELLSNFNTVEANMKARREEIEALLEKNESLLCITSFPRLGCSDFTSPAVLIDPANSPTGSLFFPDEAIFGGHPRFKTLARNIRERRKRKVIINIPIFKDIHTATPFYEHFNDKEANAAFKTDHIYMDHMGFGMGCCCLQVTFQASNLDEAKILYDQLTPLCPILMALTAASPIHRGYLSDRDCRWAVISQSVDDRTKEELGEEPLRENKFRINKSRYDSIDSYISADGVEYNDIQLTYNENYYQEMINKGVDPLIAKHIAHLFIRDPISLFAENLDQNDDVDVNHFENIQSTNWQTMRFKPPTDPSIGWRVEFRPMEVQITEFENAAFVVFIVLLTRLILTYRLNFLIQISKVDENMKEAQKRNAVQNCKFWFRKDIITSTSSSSGLINSQMDYYASHSTKSNQKQPLNFDESYVLLTVNEIINGKENHFPGLVPLLRQYLLIVDVDAETHCTISLYLALIADKASGKILTTAQWIRDFVKNHSDYKFNSIISDQINYDLLVEIDKITKGVKICEALVGDNPVTKKRIVTPSQKLYPSFQENEANILVKKFKSEIFENCS